MKYGSPNFYSKKQGAIKKIWSDPAKQNFFLFSLKTWLKLFSLNFIKIFLKSEITVVVMVKNDELL